MEQPPPRKRRDDVPARSGEEIGNREPPRRESGAEGGSQQGPLPEEETFERDRADSARPPSRDA